MIGTDENRAVLHVEVIFWGGKRKSPPSLVSGKYSPHFVVTGTTEYLGVCFLDGTERCAFDETALGNAQPLYPDTIDYAPLENNAEFLIYECLALFSTAPQSYAVMMIIMVPAPTISLIRRVTSTPSISGILKSMRQTS